MLTYLQYLFFLLWNQGARTHCYQVHCLQADAELQPKQLRTSDNNSHNVDRKPLAHSSEAVEDCKQEAPSLTCVDCSRSFQDSASLQQHRKAKHGVYPVLPPGWAMKSQQLLADKDDAVAVGLPGTIMQDDALPHTTLSSSSSSSSVECPVCGGLFSDARELQMHVEIGFRPVSMERLFKCPTCARDFVDERALRQHCNFCTSDLPQTYLLG